MNCPESYIKNLYKTLWSTSDAPVEGVTPFAQQPEHTIWTFQAELREIQDALSPRGPESLAALEPGGHLFPLGRRSQLLQDGPRLLVQIHGLPLAQAAALVQAGQLDDVVHQRVGNRFERAADDDTDGHVDDVAAHGKRLEFFHKLLHKKSPLPNFENE